MLLDGNLQYFMFLLFGQISKGFSLSPRDKALNVLNYLLYFFIIWFSVVSSFLCYYLSRKCSKYILDNWRTRIKGLISYSVTHVIRMFVFGAVHSALRWSEAQLPVLLTLEVLYVSFLLFSMRYWRVNKVAYKIWFTVIFAFLRIVMVGLLSLQQHSRIVGT